MKTDDLAIECPTCDRALAPIRDPYLAATAFYCRTCRHCREQGKTWHRWRIRVVPQEQPRFTLHVMTFQAVR